MRIFKSLDHCSGFSHHFFNFGGKSLNDIFRSKILDNSVYFCVCQDFLKESFQIQNIEFLLEKQSNKSKIFVNYERNIFLIFYFQEKLTSYPNLDVTIIDNSYEPKLVFWYDFYNYIKKRNNIYINNNIEDLKGGDLKEHFQSFPELIFILNNLYRKDINSIYYYKDNKYENIYKCFPFLVIESGLQNIGYVNLSKKINIEKYISDAIKENRAQKYSVPEDGSCLFHSLARHLTDTNENNLRKEIVKYERDNMKDLIAPCLEMKFEDYLKEMMKPTTFGGEPEIIAFSNLYKLKVAIYDIERKNTLLYGDFNKTIFLLFHKTNEHYEILDIKK